MNAADMPECTTCGSRYSSHLAAALCCDVELDSSYQLRSSTHRTGSADEYT